MTNISQKLVTIAEGLEKIRTAGWNSGFAAYAPIFWEDFNRNRADWSYMCQGWGHEEIKPSFRHKTFCERLLRKRERIYPY